MLKMVTSSGCEVEVKMNELANWLSTQTEKHMVLGYGSLLSKDSRERYSNIFTPGSSSSIHSRITLMILCGMGLKSHRTAFGLCWPEFMGKLSLGGPSLPPRW